MNQFDELPGQDWTGDETTIMRLCWVFFRHGTIGPDQEPVQVEWIYFMDLWNDRLFLLKKIKK